MKYIRNKKEFLNMFSSNLYNKIVKESTCKSIFYITKTEYKTILDNLYKELVSYEYIPDVVKERIFTYKSSYVTRILPVMSIKDELVYYFTCKILEEDIAINRVPNTFGGWRLGNEIKLQEDAEIEYVYKSYNPLLWKENWKQFQNILNIELDNFEGDDLILKLDIANFYDNININLLEKKLLSQVDIKKIEYINILIHLLKNWNLKNDKYNSKNVGIPQNEFGDQSRLLANFYLQNYDEKIKKICDKCNAKYLRYADDQIIILKNKEELYNILYVISKELNNIGLNLNSGKVKQYDKKAIREWYAIPIFKLLDDNKLDDAAKLFLDFIDNRKDFNSYSVLRRIINIDVTKITMARRSRIKSILLEYDFLKIANDYVLYKIYKLLDTAEKNEFIELLMRISNETTYNGFHYSCINFFQKIGITANINLIKERLVEISKI